MAKKPRKPRKSRPHTADSRRRYSEQFYGSKLVCIETVSQGRLPYTMTLGTVEETNDYIKDNPRGFVDPKHRVSVWLQDGAGGQLLERYEA